jgi:phosphoribulokinase
MRVNSSCLYAGIHRDRERYYINIVVSYPVSGARVKRKYFHTINEAVAYKREHMQDVKL